MHREYTILFYKIPPKDKRTDMKIEVDHHTHTIVSGHAFSTLTEMVSEAQRQGLKILGIAEHGPQIPGTCHPIYFRNLHVVPRQWGELRLLLGAELNILNTRGELDLGEEYLSRLDYRIAGIHGQCWTPGTREENTEGMIRAISNPWVNIISHPGDGTADLCFEPIVRAAMDHHVLLEVNSASMRPIRGLDKARENNLELLRLAKRYEMPILLASDAHIHLDIANYEHCYPLLQETDFPEALIMNTSAERFLEYLGIK